MKSITLGRTGLEVSRIAFGTWQLGGDWGHYDEDAAITAIHKAWDCGITLFDTAQGYGMGEAEQVLGKALKERLAAERDNVFIATKGGIDPGTDRARRGDRSSSAPASSQPEQARRRVHRPVPGALAGHGHPVQRDRGRAGGAGRGGQDPARRGVELRRRPDDGVQRDARRWRPCSRRTTSSAGASRPRCCPTPGRTTSGSWPTRRSGSGLLTGALDSSSTFADDDWRSQATAFTGDSFERNLAVVEELKELAAEKDAQVSQLAIAWVLAQPGVHVAIVGARSDRNIEASAAAADLELTQADLDRIEAITAQGTQVEGATPEGVD